MRLIIQRVAHASVTINGKVKSSIGKGLLILVGIEDADDTTDAEWLCKKVANLRIFDDENGVMNLSVKDIDGEILIISQFTLFASTKKGNRPSYIRASKPPHAIPLYETFCRYRERSGNRRIRSRYESRTAQRRPCNDMYRFKAKRITMTLQEAQENVDRWIKEYGVRYFNELTNMAILTEEVGEVARIIARRYGEQSFKESDKQIDLADELADVLWVLICLANQTGVDLTEALQKNIDKKTSRDNRRHKENEKLK